MSKSNLLPRQACKKHQTSISERDNMNLYIEPSAKFSLLAPDDAWRSLMMTVVEFLERDGRVLLLLGDSGAGKTTFCHALEPELWRRYELKRWIPLYINLSEIDRPHQDLIAKHLRRNDFTEPQIREMKKNCKFTLICDGYDESQQTRNLYESNELTIDPYIKTRWTAKMVISCRTEYLGSKQQEFFQPPPRTRRNDSREADEAVDTPATAKAPATTNLPVSTKVSAVGDILTADDFKEVEIAPFTSDKIREYVRKYVNGASTFDAAVWRTQEYMQALETVPNLLDLAKNPFLLTLSLEVLPRIIHVYQMKELSGTSITRLRLYDQFVEHWLEREVKRLQGKELNREDTEAFETLVYEGFARTSISFLKRLAVAIYKEQGGCHVVDYVQFRDEGGWKAAFFGRDAETRILRKACPLIQRENHHQFIHQSLLEYCFALAVFDPQENQDRRSVLSKTHQRNRSADFASSDEDCPMLEESLTGFGKFDILDHPLSLTNLVTETYILLFLTERAQQEPLFKSQLLALLESSKRDPRAYRAAANAITILVRSGHSFNGADLRDIKIRGADLSGEDFDSALLKGADLRSVNLRNIWLRETDMSEANLKRATFGEIPYLVQRSGVQSCVFAPDGKDCALGLCSNEIKLYKTATWREWRTLQGHDDMVAVVVYSPDGTQIASGSEDRTIRLWNPLEDSASVVFHGHTGRVDCVGTVVYSPDGKHIASASYDKTVRIWDSTSGEPIHSLEHSLMVTSVAYSPNGLQIAAGSGKEVQLWDAKLGKEQRLLSGHTDTITNIVYSPSGHQIVSSSHDKTARLWDTQSGARGPTLNGHVNSIMSIVYAPNGHQIATASLDKTVRLWDSYTGISVPTSGGHTDRVNTVTYSPKGCTLASGGFDRTLRLWNAKTGSPIKTF
ncbi:hypothetical protein BGZ70_003768, partial [Mortierella alpina]